MSVHTKLISLDTLYFSLDRKVLLNNFNHLEIDPAMLSKMLYSKYGSEISLKPSCECGYLNRSYQLGVICSKCETKVIKEYDIISPILWIKAYEEDLPFISPIYYGYLRNLFKRNVDPIRWLVDTNYNPPNIPVIMKSVAAIIDGRGYKNFIQNIKKVLIYFRNHPTFKYSGKRKKIDDLIEIYDNDKDLIFSKYLPLINKRLFVMETTNKGDYTTNMLADIIDIALTAIRIASDDISTKRLHNGIGSIISKSNVLFEKYIGEKIARKPGAMRKHIYGTRSAFTYRGVLTSFDSDLPYDEVHTPWQVLTTAFRPHVLNILMHRKGMSHKDASELMFKSTLKYNKLIDEVGQILIDESPGKGIPQLLHRNPYLLSGSSQYRYITKFKSDPQDTTISASIWGFKGQNADVDGDELNNVLLLDGVMDNLGKRMEAHKCTLDTKYFRVNKNMYMPPTVLVNLSNFMIKKEAQDENCPVFKQLQAM